MTDRTSSLTCSARSAAIECGAHPVEALHSPVVPVGHLVVPAPAPGGEHRPVHSPAPVDQILVGAGVVLSHVFGRMGEVELDRPTAAGGEVDEQRPLPRVQKVPRVRLAVQQLITGSVAADHGAQFTECVAEKRPVKVGQLGRPLPVVHLPQCPGDSVGEMRCVQIDLPQSGMVPQEHVRVVGKRDLDPTGS